MNAGWFAIIHSLYWCVVSLLLHISKSNALNLCLKWKKKMLTMNAFVSHFIFSQAWNKHITGLNIRETYEWMYVSWHACMHHTAVWHSFARSLFKTFCTKYIQCMLLGTSGGRDGRSAFVCDRREMARYVHIESMLWGYPLCFYMWMLWSVGNPLPFRVTLPSLQNFLMTVAHVLHTKSTGGRMGGN